MQTRSQSKLLLQTKPIITTTTSPIGSPSSPITRSQTKKKSIPVFDFVNVSECATEGTPKNSRVRSSKEIDGSSSVRLKNKTKLGNGTYSYKVSHTGMTTRSGKVLSA